MALKTHPETIELGLLIRLRRELAGWSQAELAERAQVSRPTIGKLEIGKAAFPKDSLAKIARALSLTIAEVAQATGRSADELRLRRHPVMASDRCGPFRPRPPGIHGRTRQVAARAGWSSAERRAQLSRSPRRYSINPDQRSHQSLHGV